MVAPAMIDTTSVLGPTNDFSINAGLAKRLRFDRDHQRIDGAGVFRGKIEANALLGECLDLVRRRCGSTTTRVVGRKPSGQPPRQHRATHFPRAGEDDGAVEVLQRVGGGH